MADLSTLCVCVCVSERGWNGQRERVGERMRKGESGGERE